MKEYTECSVVKDLMPLSIDGLTSTESEQLIQQHLITCKKCQRHLEELIEQRQEQLSLEQERDNRLLRGLKKWRYEMMGFAGAIVLVVLIIIGLIGKVFLSAGNTQEPTYAVTEHYEQAQDYGKQNYQGIAKLALFPKEDTLTGEIQEFFYDCKGSKLYQEYQIYLKCQYDASSYEKEKERLLHVTDDETGQSVVYSEEETSKPCVYAMLYDDGFEYAVFVEENNQILYIYLQGMDRRNIVFDTKYLPKDYGQMGYVFETEREPFCMYEKEWK